MKDDFFKFPSTPHLALLGGVDVRGDKVMPEPERDAFLARELVVEEKVDGANLGISFDGDGNIRAQNRGAYLSLRDGVGQWKKLSEWLFPKTDALFDHLTDHRILFGEWCYAMHSVFYDRLPDWFLGFDIYDKRTGRFLARDKRDDLFERIGIDKVPSLARGHFTFRELKEILSPTLRSRLGTREAEGLYLRHDRDDWLVQRAKLVRPDFIQSIEKHWSLSGIQKNRAIWESGTAASVIAKYPPIPHQP